MWRALLQDVELMPQHQDFGFKQSSRLETVAPSRKTSWRTRHSRRGWRRRILQDVFGFAPIPWLALGHFFKITHFTSCTTRTSRSAEPAKKRNLCLYDRQIWLERIEVHQKYSNGERYPFSANGGSGSCRRQSKSNFKAWKRGRKSRPLLPSMSLISNSDSVA